MFLLPGDSIWSWKDNIPKGSLLGPRLPTHTEFPRFPPISNLSPVPFVLRFNFFAGFVYIVAGTGLLLCRRWAVLYLTIFLPIVRRHSLPGENPRPGETPPKRDKDSGNKVFFGAGRGEGGLR